MRAHTHQDELDTTDNIQIHNTLRQRLMALCVNELPQNRINAAALRQYG